MHTDVHVQTSLDIIFHLPYLLELLGSPTHRIRQSFIFLRNPTSLHCSLLFLISLLLLVLAEQSSNWLYCLLGIDLAMITSWVLCVVELRLCPTPDAIIILLKWVLGFVFRDIVGVFLVRWMLYES